MGSARSDCIQEENYNRIIEAAKKLLSQKSSRRATFTEIAEQAGVARRTVFNIFGTKNNLLILTADSLYKDFFHLLDKATAQPAFARETGLEQILRLHVLRAKYYGERPYIVNLAHEVENMAPDSDSENKHYAQYQKNPEILLDYYWNAVEKGKRDGSVRRDLDRDTVYVTLIFSFSAAIQKLSPMYFNRKVHYQPDAVEIMRTVLRTTRIMTSGGTANAKRMKTKQDCPKACAAQQSKDGENIWTESC